MGSDEGRRTKDDGRRTTDDGRWTMDDGRWTMDDGRWTMDDGRQLRNTQAHSPRRGRKNVAPGVSLGNATPFICLALEEGVRMLGTYVTYLHAIARTSGVRHQTSSVTDSSRDERRFVPLHRRYSSRNRREGDHRQWHAGPRASIGGPARVIIGCGRGAYCQNQFVSLGTRKVA
jgi:hypothetical protein